MTPPQALAVRQRHAARQADRTSRCCRDRPAGSSCHRPDDTASPTVRCADRAPSLIGPSRKQKKPPANRGATFPIRHTSGTRRARSHHPQLTGIPARYWPDWPGDELSPLLGHPARSGPVVRPSGPSAARWRTGPRRQGSRGSRRSAMRLLSCAGWFPGVRSGGRIGSIRGSTGTPEPVPARGPVAARRRGPSAPSGWALSGWRRRGTSGWRPAAGRPGRGGPARRPSSRPGRR
jgi:hypothetical protein